MGIPITPMALAHPLHPIKSRSRNKRRNLWVGLCVSCWRPWFWSVYSIYYIKTVNYSCILSNWNKLFLRDIHTKSWCGHAGVLDDLTLLLFPGFKCTFQLYSSVFSILWYGHRYRTNSQWCGKCFYFDDVIMWTTSYLTMSLAILA